MNGRTLTLIAVALFAATESAHVQSTTEPALLGILQSELQRNFDASRRQPIPPTSSATRCTTRAVDADRGVVRRPAAQRRSRSRFATVEVRVGDYALDNTHPIRGDARAAAPRVSAGQPAADRRREADSAGALAATDRTFKQASEALTRVQTNVAAKVQDEDPAPDFSREEPQVHTGAPADLLARHARRGKRGCAASRRRSPTIRSCSAARSRCRSRPTTATTSTAKARRSPPASCRLPASSSRRVTKADDGMELPLYTQLLRDLARRPARRDSSSSPTRAR